MLSKMHVASPGLASLERRSQKGLACVSRGTYVISANRSRKSWSSASITRRVVTKALFGWGKKKEASTPTAAPVKAETPDEVAGRILKASLKVREADSKSIWLAVQKDVMAQLEAAAAAKAAAPAQPATPPPATTLKFGKPQDEVLAAEEAAFKALIESKASSAPDMAALEAAQAEVATALLEASRSVKRMTMSEIWALAESAEEKEEAASEPAPAPSQEDDAAMLAEAVAILRMSEQTRGIDARSVWKAVQEDVAAQIEAAKAAAAAKPAPTPAAAPAVGLKFGMPADDVLKAEDAAFSALIQAARASQPVESAIADRLAAREQAEAELAAALVESARNLKRMSMAEVYELAAKFDAESSVEAEAPTAEAPDTAQVIKSIADQTCSIDTASVWKAVQADVAAQLEERAKAAAAAAAKAPAKPAPAPQGLKFAKSAKDALAKEESAFAALPTASGAGVDMAAREEAEKGVAEKIMAAARKAGRVTMGEVAKKAEEFDRRAAAEAAMPEEFKQAIADEKAAFGAVKEAGAAARADPGAAQEARKSGMAQLAEAVLERARGMPKTVDIAGAFTAIQRERAEAAARAAAERDAKIKQSMEEEEALFALAREATLAMRSQKNAGDSTRDQAMEEAARQILRAARDGPRVTPSELIEAMSRIEEAPPSMRPPSSGSPVPRLSTLHVPEFIADNGDKGYFIVDLGLSEGHDPDRRLICFEDQTDAQGFLDGVKSWEQFRGAGNPEVVAVESLTMEATAVSRKCTLLVLRRGELKAAPGMTEEDLGMQLQEAYENRLYGKVVDALLEESSA